MSEFFVKLLTDIPVKIISSLIFLFVVLVLFKPWIKISTCICRQKAGFYQIKFVNYSLFSALDIKIELHSVEKYSTPPAGMMNMRYEILELKYNHIFSIHPYRPRWWRKDASHAMRLKILSNLDVILADDTKSVQVQIFAKHALTGLTKVFRQEYSNVSQIKSGSFIYGTKLSIIS